MTANGESEGVLELEAVKIGHLMDWSCVGDYIWNGVITKPDPKQTNTK